MINNMADEKTQALNFFIEGYKWAISQTGHGVHTPLPRQLKQIIKLYFKKEGVDAIASIEREALNAKGVTPSLTKRQPEAPKKGSSDRRLERIALRESGQEEGANTKARIKRMQRLAQKGLLETQTFKTESGEKEGVAEDDGINKAEFAIAAKVLRAKQKAGGEITNTDIETAATSAKAVQPLNTTEIQQIGAMGAKEIVDAYGADRILVTLEAFKDPNLSLSGSPKQLANRLKFRIYPQDK